MLLTYSRAFGIVSADIERVRGYIIASSDRSDAYDPDHNAVVSLRTALESLKDTCGQVGDLERLIPPIDRLISDLDARMTGEIISSRVHALMHNVFDELGRNFYYQVNERLVPFYTDPLPFGESVFTAFPSAIDDIQAAGRCIALGQGTAAVFHCMLVLEVGLTALAKGLQIPYAPSWESYLTQIQKKMGEKHASKTPAWRRAEAFYRDVASDLQMIKLAWRNPTMHIVRGRSYTSEEAEAIYSSSKVLMQRLATRFRENGRTRRPAISVDDVRLPPASAGDAP